MLSIVVALRELDARDPPAVAALAPRCRDRPDRELIVAAPGAAAAALARRHPDVTPVTAPAGALVPELWAAGIRAARGDVVALTTGECEPEPGWEDRLYAALGEPGVAAVGAAIDPPSGPAGAVDWAVYFCRYSAYGRPLPAAVPRDIPADSAAYRTADLAGVPESWAEGFWEPEVHAALLRVGGRLGFVPEAAVRFQGGVEASAFLRQRLLHGRRYGSDRARRFGPARRGAQAFLAPAVPWVLWARAASRVLARRRHVVRFALASPIVLLFFAAWAAGELAGTLRGPGTHARPAAREDRSRPRAASARGPG